MTRRSYWNRAFRLAPLRVRLGLRPFSERAVQKSASWPDCACGTLDPRIPRAPTFGAPRDDRLRALGNRFNHQANQAQAWMAGPPHRRERERALEKVAEMKVTMEEIDLRAHYLLCKMSQEAEA